jgi:hypothetical protein
LSIGSERIHRDGQDEKQRGMRSDECGIKSQSPFIHHSAFRIHHFFILSILSIPVLIAPN